MKNTYCTPLLLYKKPRSYVPTHPIYSVNLLHNTVGFNLDLFTTLRSMGNCFNRLASNIIYL